MRKHSKVIAAGMVAIATLGLGGVNAAWTDSASTEVQDLSTGSGTISLSAGDLRDTISSSEADLVPGDVVTRTVTVKSDTTYTLATVAMSVVATGDEELLDGSGNSVGQLLAKVTRTGDDTVLFNGAAKDMAAANIGGAVLGGAGAETELEVEITFPATAENEYKGKAAHFDYTFTATQRAGQAR